MRAPFRIRTIGRMSHEESRPPIPRRRMHRRTCDKHAPPDGDLQSPTIRYPQRRQVSQNIASFPQKTYRMLSPTEFRNNNMFPATRLHRTQNNYFLSSSRPASDAALSVPLPNWRMLRPTSAVPVKTGCSHMPPAAVPSPVLVRDKQRTAAHTTGAAAGSYCSGTRCKPFTPRPTHTPLNERGYPQKPDFPAYLLLPGHSLLALATSTRTASHTTGTAAGFRCRAHDVPRSGSFEATHKAHKKGGRSSVRPCRKAAGCLAGTPRIITRNR